MCHKLETIAALLSAKENIIIPPKNGILCRSEVLVGPVNSASMQKEESPVVRTSGSKMVNPKWQKFLLFDKAKSPIFKTLDSQRERDNWKSRGNSQAIRCEETFGV